MKDIILITNIQNPSNPTRSTAYNCSVLAWELWAERNNCEVKVITEPIVDLDIMPANYHRYFWPKFIDLEPTQQILLVDADTIPHPRTPNFFKLTGGNFCAVHDDGDYDWVCRSFENIQHHIPDLRQPFDLWKYFNSGFLIMNQTHAELMNAMIDYYFDNITELRRLHLYGAGKDQPLINLFVNKYIPNELKLLPFIFNIINIKGKGILNANLFDIVGVYHFNSLDNQDETNKWLKDTFAYFYDC